MKCTEAILSDSTRKLLWFEITKMLIAALKSKFTVLFIIISTNLCRKNMWYAHFAMPPNTFFSNRVISTWNNLPFIVILASIRFVC